MLQRVLVEELDVRTATPLRYGPMDFDAMKISVG